MGMNNLNGWAPYLEHPMTLAAFIAVIGGGVFLGTLKWAGVGKRIMAVVASVYVVCIVVALSLAVSREVREPITPTLPPATPTKTQPESAKTESPASINIQIARGSNNVITNGSEKGK